jgi:hypothetical protein
MAAGMGPPQGRDGEAAFTGLAALLRRGEDSPFLRNLTDGAFPNGPAMFEHGVRVIIAGTESELSR